MGFRLCAMRKTNLESLPFPELIKSEERKCWSFSIIQLKRRKRTSKSFRRRAIGNGSLIPVPRGPTSVQAQITNLASNLRRGRLWYYANPQPIEAGTGQPGELHLEANRNSEVDERW